jgi:hypothetical protein
VPCLAVLIALLAPRFLIVLLYFTTDFFAGVFAAVLWPVLGFFFLPTTLLWYTAVQHWYGGEWNGAIQIIGIVIALMIDVSPAGSQRKGER